MEKQYGHRQGHVLLFAHQTCERSGAPCINMTLDTFGITSINDSCLKYKFIELLTVPVMEQFVDKCCESYFECYPDNDDYVKVDGVKVFIADIKKCVKKTFIAIWEQEQATVKQLMLGTFTLRPHVYQSPYEYFPSCSASTCDLNIMMDVFADTIVAQFRYHMKNNTTLDDFKGTTRNPENECSICMEVFDAGQHKRQCVVPCGHTLLCVQCSRGLDQCPMCNGKIEKIICLY